MRVLLTTLNAKYIHTNLAIRLLYGLNKDRHAGLDWKEFTIKENQDTVAEFCATFEVVAFSCYIWNITQTIQVAEKIKAINPSVKILLGGPEVSYEWQDVIAHEAVDFIITGEGEIPFNEFLLHYPNVDAVPSLVRKISREEIHYNSDAPQFPLTDLSHIMPYGYEAAENLKGKVLYLETSRGCPYKCEFCLASLDNKVRYLPNESIKATLLYLMQNGKVIKFLDRTFNMKRDFTIDIFQFILDNHRPENVFQFEITADILHPDIIKFIRDFVPKGLFRFEIGIQTVNQKANLEVSRKQNFDKTRSIYLQLNDIVEMHLDLIVGLALDYFEDIRYSFEETFKLFAPELQLGFLKFLKGTPVREKHNQHGFVFDPNPPYQIIESNYLTRAELHQIELCEHALEVYWNKKRAFHTLRYVTAHYSIFDFLTGLGTNFSESHDLHKYTLKDVFQVLFAFATKEYPTDVILQQLIAIDYYSYYKLKPEALFLKEIPRSEKVLLLNNLQLNATQYRFVAFAISFDFTIFERENRIEKRASVVVLQYDGVQKADLKVVDLALVN